MVSKNKYEAMYKVQFNCVGQNDLIELKGSPEKSLEERVVVSKSQEELSKMPKPLSPERTITTLKEEQTEEPNVSL